MPRYAIYDELVESDRPLSFARCEGDSRPLAWRVASRREPLDPLGLSGAILHEERDFEGGPWLRFIEQGGARSRIEYAGWRFLCGENEARYTPPEEGDTRVGFGEVLERVVAPWMVLTRRHETLALHGSAVAHRGRAWALLGESGAGKSSAALECARRGSALLCDDMALVDLAALTILPGARTVRLWGEGAAQDEALEPLGEVFGAGGSKHRVALRAAPQIRCARPLGGVIALYPTPGASPRGEPSSERGAKALVALLSQSFDLSAGGRLWAQRRLELARRLLEALGEVHVLRYARSPDGAARHVEGALAIMERGAKR